MRTIYRTRQFKRDVRRMQRRGKSFDEFKAVIRKLAEGLPLEAKYREHPLIGNYAGTRECHIEPDWLLIYEIDAESLVLVRTGTHADLFE